jgi:hypothetical protein
MAQPEKHSRMSSVFSEMYGLTLPENMYVSRITPSRIAPPKWPLILAWPHGAIRYALQYKRGAGKASLLYNICVEFLMQQKLIFVAFLL